MATHRSDYLIVGNSAAGVTAAEHIRATDADASITILSREPYAVYGRPLISYLIEGKTTEDCIGFKDANFYEKERIEALLARIMRSLGSMRLRTRPRWPTAMSLGTENACWQQAASRSFPLSRVWRAKRTCMHS